MGSDQDQEGSKWPRVNQLLLTGLIARGDRVKG